MKLLVVEDEHDLNNIITKNFKKNGYSVDSAYDGEEALDYLSMSEYDAIILDVMMPKLNGYSVLQRLRREGKQVPVIMLTAKDKLEDKLTGLDNGADDYVVKPFEFKELLARIRAVIRRSYGNVDNVLSVDDVVVDINKKIVTRAGKEIELTRKEYEILEYLLQNKNRIISKEQIQEHVWDFSYEGASNIIEVLIKNLRKKLLCDEASPVIYTKRGVGYVVKDKSST